MKEDDEEGWREEDVEEDEGAWCSRWWVGRWC